MFFLVIIVFVLLAFRRGYLFYFRDVSSKR